MDIEQIRIYCLEKKGVTEGFPFGEGVLVFKVMGKMFALLALDPPFSMNLKCDPERAMELREEYDEVRPGYHMNKKHWNTVDLGRGTSNELLKAWIDHSYDLIVASLKKSDKEKLNKL